jgi:hypothetical protein
MTDNEKKKKHLKYTMQLRLYIEVPLLETTTYILAYYNTFRLVAQMHKDPMLPNVITLCLKALRLHAYDTTVDHASTMMRP